MNETSGVLRPAVEAYLFGEPMSIAQVLAMRAYFRQWIEHPGWTGPMLDVLRTQIDVIETRGDIERWLERAYRSGIDPL